MIYRYLLNVAYIGTPFKGMQRLIKFSDTIVNDTSTVQGRIEIALGKLNPVNPIIVAVSSRTDSGVHAFQNSVHVDLEKASGTPYPTKDVTLCLNKYFQQQLIPIRILSTYVMPTNYHSRWAESRTYMYRLGILKSDSVHEKNLLRHLPIEEFDRALFLCTSTFDVDKLREAAGMFVGYHDFRTFMFKATKKPDKVTRRNMHRLDIEEASPFCYHNYSWPDDMTDYADQYKFYNIYLQASGFLHKQVRRTVAALIGVAKGVITARDVKFMLEVPSHNSWDPRLKTVPAHALYLCRVTYPKHVVETFRIID